MTIGNLYNFFSNVVMYHTVKRIKDQSLIASALGVNPYFVKDYEAARNYPLENQDYLSFEGN